MAYKALYRTYRPSTFEEVAGQQHIVKTLQHAVEQNKIAHAYLFCGPRGTGKTSIAKIYAKTINCESEDKKPCQVCDNCLALLNGSHPDIIEIDAASNNGVDEVRTLIEKVKYAPLKGRYKIYIIDEVHMMSTGAFNALLKTIEEPPEHIIFILATTEPHKVLPTIISRCQRFDFTKVPKDEIVKRLQIVMKYEDITCEDEVIRIIAQLADGGLRDALSILDQCIAYAQNNIKVQHINEIYGITTIAEKLALFENIYSKNALQLLTSIDNIIENGIDIKRLTVDLIEILKESIVFEYTKDSSLLQVLQGDEVSQIAKIPIKRRFEMIYLLMETYDQFRNAASVTSYFEVCLLQMLDDTVVKKEDATAILEEKEVSPVTKPLPIEHDEQKTILNVSRETSINEVELNDEEDREEHEITQDFPVIEKEASVPLKVKSSVKPFENEYILGLLAGATKPEKAEDIKHFKRIDEYEVDFKWGKQVHLLKNSKILGSGHNYIVICVDNQAIANQINELDSMNEFNDFIMELGNKSKKIFAISKDQQKKVIAEFKECMLNGTLPEPVLVENVVIHKKIEVKKTQQDLVLDLFGEENIIITEE